MPCQRNSPLSPSSTMVSHNGARRRMVFRSAFDEKKTCVSGFFLMGDLCLLPHHRGKRPLPPPLVTATCPCHDALPLEPWARRDTLPRGVDGHRCSAWDPGSGHAQASGRPLRPVSGPPPLLQDHFPACFFSETVSASYEVAAWKDAIASFTTAPATKLVAWRKTFPSAVESYVGVYACLTTLDQVQASPRSSKLASSHLPYDSKESPSLTNCTRS